jgi:predicted ABC-class ATPase
MLPAERLRDKLLTVEGKPYAAYKTLEGAYRFDRFVLYFDHVQGDVHGAPSLMRVRVDQGEAQFPQTLWSTRARRVALEDYLIRQWHEAIRKHTRLQRGNPPGSFSVDVGGQQVLERTGCRVAEDYVEIRGRIVLAAEGRKPASKVALAMLMEELPEVVDHALLFPKMNAPAVHRHVEVVEDAEALRGQLRDQGLVAFLGDESVLPREGSTDRPLLSHFVTLQAPDGLRSTLQATHRGAVTGLGIPRGVTVILGTTFAGKSTLLRAIAAGVYNHVPGDGREHCVTVTEAVQVQTEVGRRIERVDLTPFVSSLPTGNDPSRYRTNAATEALAQAAGIMEALEAGSSLLLFDADSTAIPLLMRDELLARLIHDGLDPIIPLADLLRPLYEEHGVSSILVTSLSDRYVAAADTVIVMDQFRPRIVTTEAKAMLSESIARQEPRTGRFGSISRRVPTPDSVAGLRGRKLRAELVGARTVAVGREHLDLSRIEHLVEASQAKTVGDALIFAAEHGYIDGTRTLTEVITAVDEEIAQRGLEVLSPYSGHPGDYVRPRRYEVAAALNRLRSLHVKQ